MALPSVRMEYRVQLSHVDRGVDTAQTVVAALHPSETAEHLALRELIVLACDDGDVVDAWFQLDLFFEIDVARSGWQWLLEVHLKRPPAPAAP